MAQAALSFDHCEVSVSMMLFNCLACKWCSEPVRKLCFTGVSSTVPCFDYCDVSVAVVVF